MTRLALIHRSPLLCDALARRLTAEAEGIEVVLAESRPARVLGRMPAEPPHVAVVDADLDAAERLALCRDLDDRFPTTAILVVGELSESDTLELVEAGARGFVEAGFGALVRAIESLVRHRSRCSLERALRLALRLHEARKDLQSELEAPPPAVALSAREQEVLGLVAAGLCNKEIAQRLGIRLATVKNHVHRILAKLEANNRREAARNACRLGLVQSH